MESKLRRVAAFADKAHGNQQRKYTAERYIEHPLRVMRICKAYGYPLPVLSAAILHDVVEDTPVTQKQISEFLLTIMSVEEARHTYDLVTELTDVYTTHEYPRINRRKRKLMETDRLEMISEEAQTIKYADIMDNAKEIAEQDPDFAPVYLKECRMLIGKMKNGNANLREEAIGILKKGLKQFKVHEMNVRYPA